MGARSSRAEKTRKAIMDAGRAAFSRMSYSEVRLQKDILSPAGISIGSFYHQFEDKSDLLIAILREFNDTVRSEMSALEQSYLDMQRSGDELLRAAIALVFDRVDAHPEVAAILAREHLSSDDRVSKFLEEDLKDWESHRTENQAPLVKALGFDLDLELATEMMNLIFDGCIRRYLRAELDERPALRRRLANGISHLVHHGFAGMGKD